MAFKQMLSRLAAEIGANDLTTNTDLRLALTELINVAAEEVWEEADLPGCLREVFVNAYSNEELALPSFVGSLRAIREAQNKIPWRQSDFYPRFSSYPWKSEWREFSIKYSSAVQLDILNSAPPTASMLAADLTTTLTIVGATASANRVVETVTMDGVSKLFTSAFTRYDSIQKNKINSNDITLTDADARVLAVISNDQLESHYLIVDVSNYPYTGELTDGGRVMEVLYKVPLLRLEADTDVFPVEGFDNIVVMKARQLYYEPQEGKEAMAIMMDRKTSRQIRRKIGDKTGNIQKVVNFGRNPLYSLYYSGATRYPNSED